MRVSGGWSGAVASVRRGGQQLSQVLRKWSAAVIKVAGGVAWGCHKSVERDGQQLSCVSGEVVSSCHNSIRRVVAVAVISVLDGVIGSCHDRYFSTLFCSCSTSAP